MAKIGIADSTALKFSRGIKEHWESKGHEVRYEIGASEHIAQWADIYYLDWSDNNIHYLYKFYHDQLPEYPEGSKCKKPKIVVRAIDWDIWIGFARNQDLVSWVDQWICIAPHLEAKLRKEAQYRQGQLVCIRPGVDLAKFPPKTKQTDGHQLGMVLGDMWWYKNHMSGLDIFTTLAKKDAKWRLHIRGQHEPGEFNPVMYQYYLESRGIADKVTLYPPQDDINNFYENIDILLHPGMKEGFCYAVAEAMSKCIHCVVNDFYGSHDIWPDYLLYQTNEHAVNKIFKLQDNMMKYRMGNVSGRGYIREHYDINRMMEEYDQLLEL